MLAVERKLREFTGIERRVGKLIDRGAGYERETRWQITRDALRVAAPTLQACRQVGRNEVRGRYAPEERGVKQARPWLLELPTT